MVRLHDWHIQNVNGRRLLRFTTIFVNAGPGRFELRGGRSSQSDKTMEMDQMIYRADGSRVRRGTQAVAMYAGDGHDHWHVQGVVTYEAWALSGPQDARRGAKTGFCFFDTTPWDLSLPHARQTGFYKQEWCGTQASLTNRVGVSVGWGDRYPWDFVFQWIDITGLPGGTYRVRATVDIHDFYRETDEFDNCVWSEVRIPAPGSGNKREGPAQRPRMRPQRHDPRLLPSLKGRRLIRRGRVHRTRRPCGVDLQLGRHAPAQPVARPVGPANRDRHGARHPARWLGQLALHGVGAVRRLLAQAGPGRPARALTPSRRASALSRA